MKYFSIWASALFLLFSLGCNQSKVKNENHHESLNHNQLRERLTDSISKYKALVGLSVIDIETNDTFSINGTTGFAMQSVYKLPLALAVLNKVEKGQIERNIRVFFSNEMLDKYAWSPLKRQNPGNNFYMSLDSVLMYMMAYSDNLACDILFDLVGGTTEVEKFIGTLGFKNIHLKYTEKEMGEELNRMYVNSSHPNEMSALLKAFYERKIINKINTDYLLNLMINDSTSHKRIIGNLPIGTKVAHKTGTCQESDSLINACNDVGIMYLPNGKRIAIAIFVMNSKESYEETEKLIAILSKEVYDFYK